MATDPASEGGLTPEQERLLRGAFCGVCEGMFGPQDAAALRGDWERFRASRLPEVVAAARALPDGDGQRLILERMQTWLLEQAMTEALASPGSGFASTCRLRPDGKVEHVWFRRRPPPAPAGPAPERN